MNAYRSTGRTPAVIAGAMLLLGVVFAPCAWAAEDDAIIKTIEAELKRSMDKLKLKDSPKPYYVDCSFTLSKSVNASAELGALTSSGSNRHGRLKVSVRVGDYKLDNTNFSGNMMWGGWSELDSPMSNPIDGDMGVLRRAVWWSIDMAYKKSVENLKRKKTVLKNKSLPPVADDFAQAPVTKHVGDTKPAKLPDAKSLADLVRAFSGQLKNHPTLNRGAASMGASTSERWFVNSEGTKTYAVVNQATCSVNAIAQADDGVVVADGLSYVQKSFDALPARGVIEKDVKALGARVEAMRTATLLDDFVGPVLFEGEAAPAICRRLLAGRFGSQREPIRQGGSWGGNKKSLRRKLGRRVMATSFNVYDDPTVDVFEGVSVLGKVAVDMEGVKCEPVHLVRNGILKALLTTRTPDKKLPKSNGHAFRSSYGWWGGGGGYNAGISNLIVTYKDGLEEKALKARFMEAIKDQEVEYGLIVRKIPHRGVTSGSSHRVWYGRSSSQHEVTITEPLYAFRVFPDGKEELVRVVNFKGIGLFSFKDVLAAGKKLHAKHGTAMHGLQSILAPSMLFEEGMVEKPEGNVAKPPRVKSPMLAKSDK